MEETYKLHLNTYTTLDWTYYWSKTSPTQKMYVRYITVACTSVLKCLWDITGWWWIKCSLQRPRIVSHSVRTQQLIINSYTVFTRGDRRGDRSRDRSPRSIASCKHAIRCW